MTTAVRRPVVAHSPGAAALIFVGGALTVVGSFAPWVVFDNPYGDGLINVSGAVSGADGNWTFIIGFLVAAFGFVQLLNSGQVNSVLHALSGLAAGLVTLVAVIDLNSLSQRLPVIARNTGSMGVVGAGLPMLLTGAAITITGVIGGLYCYEQARINPEEGTK